MAAASLGSAPGAPGRSREIFLSQVLASCTPFLMGVLFFGILTPLALMMRAAGYDPLRLRFAPQQPSYWAARNSRGGRQTRMGKQF